MKNRNLLYIILFCSLVFLLRIPGLYQPLLDIDESVFSEFGNIILNGGLPYIDAVDNKPPLMYYFFTSVYYLFGQNNLIAAHIITTLIVIITGLLIYKTVFKLTQDKTPAFASLGLFLLLSHIYEPKYISTSGEVLINLPLAVSAYLFIKYRNLTAKKIYAPVISGIMLGTAIMTSYKAGILAVVFIIHCIIIMPFTEKDKTGSQILLNQLLKLTLTGISSLIPIAVILFYFKSIGNLDQFIFWGFTYNFGYIGSGSEAVPISRPLGRTAYFLFCSMPAWIPVIIFSLRRFRSKIKNEILRRDDFLFLITWTALSFYAALLGGRCYGHYFIQIILPLSILGGIAYYSIYKNTGWHKAAIVFSTLALLIFTIIRIDIDKTYEFFKIQNWHANVSYKKTGEYIKADSRNKKNKIFVWGWATPIYTYSDMRSASRFLITDFITGRTFCTPNDSDIIRKEIKGKNMDLLLEDLYNNKPSYFINTAPSDYYGYSRFPLENYPAVNKFVKDKYRLVETIDGIEIYKKI